MLYCIRILSHLFSDRGDLPQLIYLNRYWTSSSHCSLDYIPVLQKLLLLRMIVMLNRTILKPMLLRCRIFTLLAFGLFMCPPMLAMLPARVLHSTRLIHTWNIFIVKSGRLRRILLPNPNPFCYRLFVHILLTVCLLHWTKLSLVLIFFRNIGFIPLPAFIAVANPYMCFRTKSRFPLFQLRKLSMPSWRNPVCWRSQFTRKEHPCF